MPQNDPTNYSLVTYAWVLLLSIWGGVVRFVQKLRRGECASCGVAELAGEIVIAGFAGIITFYLCEASGIDKLITAAMVGISGHMGSRAIMMLERELRRRIG